MVSVIIPAYNASITLSNCLSSLMEQDCAEEYEVIVVDDGSSDQTPDIARGFKGVTLIQQENAGPAKARNNGVSHAKGDIVLFTDSDCTPAGNWISEMIRPFKEDPEVVGVKGAYRTGQKEITARFIQFEYENKYRYMMKERYIDFIDTYSAGFKKDVFLEMNGYNTDFPVACAEDVELSYRLSEKGHKMVFNPDAIVSHIHPDSPLDYLKKKYKFAYWRMLAFKLNPGKAVKDSHTPQLMKFQILFPPAIIAAAALSLISSSLAYLSLLLIALFILTTLGFVLRVLKSDTVVGLLAPAFLFLRAAAQFLGVTAGGINANKG